MVADCGQVPQTVSVPDEADSPFQKATERLMGLGTDNTHVADNLGGDGWGHRFLATEQLRQFSTILTAALLEPVTETPPQR